MRIKLTTSITGSVDEQAYPPPGVPFDVPDNVGATLCARGLAVPVRTDLDAELRGTEKHEHVLPKQGAEATASTRVSKSHVSPTETQHTDITGEPAAPVKRGPGRPRKHPRT